MKNLLLILVLSLFSIQSFAGSCPDGSEPIKSISADGTYFEYMCGSNINDSNTRDNSNRMDSCDADWTSCFPTRENFQKNGIDDVFLIWNIGCLLYTSPSPRDA